MTAFIDQFAACVQRERVRLAPLFGSSAGEDEAALRQAIRDSWYPLPRPTHGQPRRTFAADGSQAIRYFNNGWCAIICQALCIGPAVEAPSVDLRFVRSTLPEVVLHRYAGLLMRLLELRAALAQVERAAGGVICLDGSLHTVIPHLLYPLACPNEEDLPLVVLEQHLELIEACRARDVLLVSLSKTSTGSFLGEALLRLRDDEPLAADVDLEAEPLPPLPSDVEALFRWTREAGLSRPVVLGSYGFGNRREQLIRAPESVAHGFNGERYTPEQRVALLRRVVEAPATVSTYMRLRTHDDPIRLDVPADAVGLDDRIGEVYLGWGDAARLAPALGHVVGAYGGRSVYHAALYVADRLVRLSRTVVDTAYLSIIRAQFGTYIEYDRSRRRFL